MTQNIATIKNLVDLLGRRETAEVVRLAAAQQRIEIKWARVMVDDVATQTDKILARARRRGDLIGADVDFDVLDVLMEHSRATMRAGIESTEVKTPIRRAYLAAPPPGRVPKSLKALREWWDAYRKGKVPARQRALAGRIRAAYVDELQKAWRTHSAGFLSGDVATQAAAVDAIKQRASVAASRAKMIVETETTYYFNKARRQIYDDSPDVSHYLFVAVRDHATTKWCKTRNGLVYAKGDPLLDKETPPIHWNCRSELLPLLPHNPNHQRIISDRSRWRRNNRCEPLPPEWTGARRTR